MKKHLIIIVFLIPITLFSGWEKTFGSPLWDCMGNSIIQTSDSGFLVTADVVTGVSYDLERKVYILKLNSQGDSLWGREFNGDDWERGLNSIQTYDGGFATFGWTRSFGSGFEDIWIIKTDSQGYLLWNKTHGTSDFNDYGMCGQQTSDSGYIIVGYRGYWLFYNIWLIKTNLSGDTLWTRILGSELGSQNVGIEVQVTSDQGYIIIGYTNEYLTNDNKYDFIVFRTDNLGNVRWSKIFGVCDQGIYDADKAFSLDQTSDGGFIITGTCHLIGDNNQNVYILKIDSLGCKQWEKIYGGSNWEEALSVQQCTDHGYIIAGTTKSFGNGNKNIYLIRTDSMGDSLWIQVYGGYEDDGAKCVRQTVDGGFIICGWTESFSGYKSKIYIVKTNQNGVAVEENVFSSPQQSYFSVIPLDNHQAQIRFSLVRSGQVRVEAYDLSGRRVDIPGEGFYPAGEHFIYWPVPRRGVYFFRISSDNLNQTVKLAAWR